MNKYNNLFYIINSLIARYFIDFCKILNQFRSEYNQGNTFFTSIFEDYS
jgi:hypothetical protein